MSARAAAVQVAAIALPLPALLDPIGIPAVGPVPHAGSAQEVAEAEAEVAEAEAEAEVVVVAMAVLRKEIP